VGTIADLRRRLKPWQLRLLDLGLPLLCALFALILRIVLGSWWLLAVAVLVAGWLIVRDSRRRARRAPAAWAAVDRVLGRLGRALGSWQLWLLDAGLALALTLLSLRISNGLDDEWAAFGLLLIAGLLIQRRWPVAAAVLACAGAMAHFFWGPVGPMPLDLAAPITVYTLASRASRRRVAVLAVGALLAGIYATSLIHEVFAARTGDAVTSSSAEATFVCPPNMKPVPGVGCIDPMDLGAKEWDAGIAPPCAPGQVRLDLGCVYPDDYPDELRKQDEIGRVAAAEDFAGGGDMSKPILVQSGGPGPASRLLNAVGNGLLPMLVLGLALAFGDGVRSRRAHLRTLEQRAADLEREQDQRAALAAAAERARITRELHDVVAHGMSVMVVQAQGAAAALNRHPDRTADALQNVIAAGRSSMAEMRRLLGVVSRSTDDPELAPQPGLGALPALVDQVRAAGTPVRLSIEGEPVPLPTSVDLSAYRIAQEALTNTIKHAGEGASAQVRIAFSPDWLEVEISDDGAGHPGTGGGGNGLRGIAERVDMLGGMQVMGPALAGGFRVWALLPIQPTDPGLVDGDHAGAPTA
jgi:signal transduction histidine kinase